MKASHKTFRRAALCIALGACFAATTPVVFAQSATGAVAGRASAGDQITIVNTATGASRTVTVSADGAYRLTQLPVGDYELRVARDGQAKGQPISVNVQLGGTTTVNLGGDGSVTNLDAIQVVGSRVINRVDVRSTESATNIVREEISRLPVAQSLSSVALLTPGVIAGATSNVSGLSFGGSSVAENSVFINGLNVTDFYKRHSFSTAPFDFFQEFQVKTGGYSVEFGRATGGVINAVTRRGSNEFQGGATVTFEPAAWKSEGEDHYYANGSTNTRSSRDMSSFTKANVWASGPIVQDKLFLFAMYEQRDSNSRFTNAAGSSWTRSGGDNGFWGAKLDWNISDDHLFELLAFSDESTGAASTYAYNWNQGTTGALTGDRFTESGGKSGSATYTGHFGENFTAKAMYGINRSSSFGRSPADLLCDQVGYENLSYGAVYVAMGSPVLGCHPGGTVVTHEDERKVKRLEFEWALGDHLLRFGWDHELMTTDRVTYYPGPTRSIYTAYGRLSPTQVLDNLTPLPTGVNAYVRARERADGGVFDIEASAFYLEDFWTVTPNLVLNLGLRVDNFDNMDAAGNSFIELDNLVSPRLGFSWDMKGDATTKLYGNVGRYYMPIPSIVSYNFAGGLTDDYTFYVLDGWRQEVNPITGAPYMAPILGAQIGPVYSQSVVVNDTRQTVDRDLDPVYQDEAILGFQQMINQAWSWGVNATYRRMVNAIDDIRINQTECGPIYSATSDSPTGSIYPIGNPGKPLTLWGSTGGRPNQIRCAADGWITIDTSTEGYRMAGSNNIIGYYEPKRTYKAVEFQIDRAWDEKWAFNASYLWSKSEGNHEGPVNSDTNYGDTAMVQHWDHPANNQRYGYLFNDHRHQIKLRGSYKLNEMWTFGSTFTALSGGPITAFGVTWPNENAAVASFTSTGSGGGTGWLCVQNCNDWANRVHEWSPRGAFGRMPWVYNLGASVTWTLPVESVDLKARFSVYNLLNRQEVVAVSARYESNPGVVRSTFGTGTAWQSPRYAQLVVTWNF